MIRGLLLSWGILATTALAQMPVANTRPSSSAPAPAEIMPETVRSFNPLALQLAWNDRRWQIVHENDVLKEFGPHEQEARQALRMIQELGVNQYAQGDGRTPAAATGIRITSGGSREMTSRTTDETPDMGKQFTGCRGVVPGA